LCTFLGYMIGATTPVLNGNMNMMGECEVERRTRRIESQK
jgi:hypothetical protein